MKCPSCTGNEARYTTSTGARSCALCCVDDIALRDIDLPDVIVVLDALLNELDRQLVSTGKMWRDDLRGRLGRRLVK